MSVSHVVVLTIVVALAFDLINGFHDAANSIATIVSTRLLSPVRAVIWAATFNFAALFVFHQGVAKTVSSLVKVNAADPAFVWVVLAGLIGAIFWNLLTWWLALPSSSSHAIMGGFSGAGVAYGGTELLNMPKLTLAAEFIVISPVLGMLLGGGLMVAVSWLLRRKQPGRIDRWFRRLQFMSSALFSLGHGANDAQKTMGIIMAMLIAKGRLNEHDNVPIWVILSCQLAMGLGTLSGG